MKLNKKLTPVVMATTLAMGALAAPGMASAEVSANMSVANFYLWRGLDISAGAPEVSGGLDYSHDSGFYAGVWTSSEEAGSETDLYIGFAGEAGPLSYDISAWEYLYPSDNNLVPPLNDYSDSDLSEFVIGLGAYDVGLTVYFGNDTGLGSTVDYTYTTLDYTYGDFNILYGVWAFDPASGNPDGDAHLTFSYAATDNFTFTITKGFQNDVATTMYDEDFLFHVSYSLPVEMK